MATGAWGGWSRRVAGDASLNSWSPWVSSTRSGKDGRTDQSTRYLVNVLGTNYGDAPIIGELAQSMKVS